MRVRRTRYATTNKQTTYTAILTMPSLPCLDALRCTSLALAYRLGLCTAVHRLWAWYQNRHGFYNWCALHQYQIGLTVSFKFPCCRQKLLPWLNYVLTHAICQVSRGFGRGRLPALMRATTHNWHQTLPPLSERAEFYYLLLVQYVVLTVCIYVFTVTALFNASIASGYSLRT